MTDENQVAKNEREDHVLAGDVSVEEAREILSMFISSHFRNREEGPHGRARFTIPANPQRDSDIRLSAFIARASRAFDEIARIRAALDESEAREAALREMHARDERVPCPACRGLGGTDDAPCPGCRDGSVPAPLPDPSPAVASLLAARAVCRELRVLLDEADELSTSTVFDGMDMRGVDTHALFVALDRYEKVS